MAKKSRLVHGFGPLDPEPQPKSDLSDYAATYNPQNGVLVPLVSAEYAEYLKKKHGHGQGGGNAGDSASGGPVRVPGVNPPTNIFLTDTEILQNDFGSIVGAISVIDADLPDDIHTFILSDSRFEVSGGYLKLKAGEQVTGTSDIDIDITVTDEGGQSVTVSFTITIITSGSWILADGFWDDSAVWDDGAVWIDGPSPTPVITTISNGDGGDSIRALLNEVFA